MNFILGAHSFTDYNHHLEDTRADWPGDFVVHLLKKATVIPLSNTNCQGLT